MALCTGTNVVFSRKALTSIGGWGVESCTEDVLTSYLLNGECLLGLKCECYCHTLLLTMSVSLSLLGPPAGGYQGCYLDETLAFGLNPSNIKDYCEQRQRWIVGSMDVFRNHNPLFKKGLTPMETISYFAFFSKDYMSVPRLVLLLTPLVFMFWPHLALLNMSVFQWLSIFLPYFLLCQAQVTWLVWSLGLPLNLVVKSQQEMGWLTFQHLRAVFKAVIPVSSRLRLINQLLVIDD